MSNVVKGVANVVKKVGGAVKNVVSGIGKTFKKVWDSSVGRIVLVAAAVAVGGWALGAWGGGMFAGTTTVQTAAQLGMQGATGASIYGGGAAAGAAGTASTAVTGLGAGVAASNAPVAGGGAPAAVVPGGGAGAAAAKAVPHVTATMPTGAAAIAQNIKAAAGIVGGWAQQNPLVAYGALNAGASMLTPSEAEEQAEYDKRQRKRRERNLDVGGIDLGPLPGAPGPAAQPALVDFARPSKLPGAA